MAKNKKNTAPTYENTQNNQQANQFYVYDPAYGFVPVEQNGFSQTQTNSANIYPPYGQGYGQFGAYQGQFRNPMQMNHTMQMNAMQEEINQLKLSLGQETKKVQNQITPEKMQEIYTVVDQIAKGQAGPEKLLPLMQNTSMDFWKGLALGAGAILVYNCTPLKDIINNLLGAGMASFMPNNATDDDGFDSEFDEDSDEIDKKEKK